MQVFCHLCKEAILETSDKFVPGGPYDGSMFKALTNDRWSTTMFRTIPEVKGGDLQCPRCTGLFIQNGGCLLTEHGDVKPEQRSINTERDIVWRDGPAKGQLKRIEDSELAPVEVEPEETRDEKILRLKKEGMSNVAVGETVGVSESTVRNVLKKKEVEKNGDDY